MEVLMESAKVMPKGQVTIPKNVRTRLNLQEGSQLVFVYDDKKVVMMNSAIYAMQLMQETMKGKAKNSGIKNENDVVKLVKKIRKKK